MDLRSDQIRRVAGLSGLAGALLFFAGDMLFYGHVGPGAGFRQGMVATVTQASPERLFAGGLVAKVPTPFGAVLVGGFANQSIAAFFLASAWTTWRPRCEA
jgi:hypothetical protein